MLKERFCVLDFETSGLDPVNDRVISVGIVVFEKGKEVFTRHTLISSDVELSQKITDLTGIKQGDLKGKPLFKDIANKLLGYLQDSEFIVAYNAAFDLSFLKYELHRVNKSLPVMKVLDVYEIAKPLLCRVRGLPNFKLQSIVKHFGINTEGMKYHRADIDARLTGKVLLLMSNMKGFYKLRNVNDLNLSRSLLDLDEPKGYCKYRKEIDVFRNIYSQVPAPAK